MREDSELPLLALQRGFSSSPGQEEYSEGGTANPQEKLVTTKPPKNNPTEKPHKTRKNVNIKSRNKPVNKKYMKNHVSSTLKLFSTNGAGVIGGKITSLQAQVNITQANVVTIQETHARRKGKIQLPDMVVFEAIRKAKGGGTLIATHKSLNPRLIEEYEDDFELLVVEVELKNKNIRVISGYGPQENWSEDKRRPFFVALETEVEKANLAGKPCIIEIDANAKLGNKYIAQDPHTMSPNGAILASLVERQQLIVGNGRSICQGTITRIRNTRNRTEKSVIDLVLFSSDLNKNLVTIKIDEKREHVLTKVVKTKKGPKLQESDHNPIITEFNLVLKECEEEEKYEIYNLKSKEGQEKFKEYTSNTKMLSSVFNSSDDINTITNRFIKKLNGCISKSFRKVRVTKKDNKTC
jgi:exonuclease III